MIVTRARYWFKRSIGTELYVSIDFSAVYVKAPEIRVIREQRAPR